MSFMDVDSLPNELWLQIFIDFDYFDLKKCQRVCKKFLDLIADRVFDKILFRTKAIPAPKPSEYQCHPGLARLLLDHRFGVMFVSPDSGHHSTFDTTQFKKEFATFPRATIIELDVFKQKLHLAVRNSTGVTLGDVLYKLNEAKISLAEDFWEHRYMQFKDALPALRRTELSGSFDVVRIRWGHIMDHFDAASYDDAEYDIYSDWSIFDHLEDRYRQPRYPDSVANENDLQS